MLSVNAGFQSLVDELAAMLEPLQIGMPRRPPFALVERAGAYELYRLDKTGPVLVKRGDLDDLARAKLPREVFSQPVEVRLDGSRVLSKLLQLPAASRSYLDSIVAHQVERNTPWAADRVVFFLNGRIAVDASPENAFNHCDNPELKAFVDAVRID